MMRYRSNGKLLLTGEYLVLDGALALAIPTQLGQVLEVQSADAGTLLWESFDRHGDRWLQVRFELPSLRILTERFNAKRDGAEDSLGLKLQELLSFAKSKNPAFLATQSGYHVRSSLEFPRPWGLGSSSTLVSNVAQWSNTDPFFLQFESFGGSAYDVACAQSSGPIHYRLKEGVPEFKEVYFAPTFKDQLYFVFLNQKQNSRDAIQNYKANYDLNQNHIDRISALTKALTHADSLTDFEKIMAEHEALVSSVVGIAPIQDMKFSDYFGQTKSLGAWGGDFILATGNDDTPNYFKNKGYNTVISYQELAL